MFLSAWNHDYLSVYLLVFLGEELCHYENASVRSSACVCVCVRICSCACAPTPTMSHGTVYVCLWWTGFKEVWRPDWLLVGCWLNIRMFICWVLTASWPSPMPEITVYSVLCCELALVMKIFRLHWSTIKRAAVAYHWHSVVGCLLESNTIAF